ncbi:hypothetical protein AB0392_14620 [Nonomuraea angiospora]|uniref:hypothetical protein n=1 Tax=Nonomuraea angiospora TaxID=46172 RepID=UPI0034501ED2
MDDELTGAPGLTHPLKLGLTEVRNEPDRDRTPDLATTPGGQVATQGAAGTKPLPIQTPLNGDGGCCGHC